MNIIDENKYIEIKNVLNGCNNIDNAKLLFDIYMISNPETKKIIDATIYGKNYNEQYSYKEFSEIMKKIRSYKYKENCIKFINELYPFKNTNELQLKTLYSIIENKETKKKEKNEELFKDICLQKKDKKENKNSKSCPHCGEEYYGDEYTTYVICGYKDTHNGYNWTGCQKDWCYKCGKKLCKSWNEDKLYLEPNRIHNFDCCVKYANSIEDTYNNYCVCNNKYVNRNKKQI